MTEKTKNSGNRIQQAKFNVSISEYKEIKDFVKNNTHQTLSEFYREAIFNKIRAFKNPNLFGVNPMNNDNLKIGKMLDKMDSLFKDVSEWNKINSMIMNNLLNLQGKSSSMENIDIKDKMVEDAIRSHRETPTYKQYNTGISLKELEDPTKLEQNEILTILTTMKLGNGNNKYRMTKNGKWDINE